MASATNTACTCNTYLWPPAPEGLRHVIVLDGQRFTRRATFGNEFH